VSTGRWIVYSAHKNELNVHIVRHS
jgi:hypothetical protein